MKIKGNSCDIFLLVIRINWENSIFVDLAQMCNALKISIPNELLNSPFLKTAMKKRQANAYVFPYPSSILSISLFDAHLETYRTRSNSG